MPHYHFDIQDGVGEIEDLGGMVLTDDAEAVAFCESVIRDLLRDNRRRDSQMVGCSTLF